jgi:transcriptional regulator with PAS, ATPase and Fis domain
MESWLDEDEAAITICDVDGVIVYVNQKSKKSFANSDDSGVTLGSSLIECHPEPARSKLLSMLKAPQTSIYTIEKRGVKKIIRQSPWYKDGIFSGVIEVSFEIPSEMPHFIRDKKA